MRGSHFSRARIGFGWLSIAAIAACGHRDGGVASTQHARELTAPHAAPRAGNPTNAASGLQAPIAARATNRSTPAAPSASTAATGPNAAGSAPSASAATTSPEAPPLTTTLVATRITPLNGNGSESLWSAVDGNPTTVSAATGSQRFRLQFSGRETLSSIAVLSSADGTLTVESDDDSPHAIGGLERIAVHGTGSSRWLRTQAESPYVAGTVLITWTPASEDTPMPEIVALGRTAAPALRPAQAIADQLTAGVAHPRIDVAASPESVTISAPAALDRENPQSISFQLPVPPSALSRAFVYYSLTGLQHWTSVVRSINGGPAEGGFHPVRGSAGGMEAEEIDVRSLRAGNNTIRFYPADAADAAGYRIAHARLVAFTASDELEADAEIASELVGAADDGRALVDGHVTTGATGATESATTGHAPAPARPRSNGYALEYGSPAQPLEVAFHIAQPLSGMLELTGAGSRAHQRIGLDGLAAGWHSTPIDESMGPSTSIHVAVRAGHESTGLVSEVHVTSLPLARADAHSPHIALFHPLHGECVANDGVSIRGSLARDGSDPETALLFVDGARVSTRFAADGAFAVTVPEPGGPRGEWHVRLRAVFPDGVEAAKDIALSACSTAAPAMAPTGNEPVTDEGAPFGEIVHAGEAKTITYGDVRIEIPAGAVAQDTRMTVRPLAEHDVPDMEPGMTNLVPGGGAFRLGPLHSRFEAPLRLALPFDAAQIPEGMEDAGVGVFFYDEGAHHWRQVPSVGRALDGRAVAETTHYTDFVVSTVPPIDHPGSASFNPNTIRDVKVGDPSAGVTLIQPPTANASGAAQLSFPIDIVPGRALTPSLAVTYSSERPDGWMGVGWDLEAPSIEIDTRFGVPAYDDAQRHERYLLNGAQLVRVRDLDGGDVLFARRIEGSFERIVRHGDSATNYWWEISDRSGVVTTYGRIGGSTNPSRLAAPTDHVIFRWSLDRVRDPFGNVTRYFYEPRGDRSEDHLPGPSAATGNPWAQLYLEHIEYGRHHTAGTGDDEVDVEPYYQVSFVRAPRPNGSGEISSARAGFDVRTRDVLHRVRAEFHPLTGDPVSSREYVFDYEASATTLGKPRLTRVTVYGRNGASPLYHHDFDYYNATTGFDRVSNWGSTSFDGSIHESLRLGGGIQATGGIAAVCYAQFAVSVGVNPGVDFSRRAMVDVNGDGLPDVLSGPELGTGSVQLNRLERTDRSTGSFESSSVETNGALGASYTVSAHLGVSLQGPPLGGVDGSLSLGGTRQYRVLADADGDGLVDIARTAPDLLGGNSPIHILRNPFYGDVANRGAFGCESSSCEYDIGGLHEFEQSVPIDDATAARLRQYTHATVPVVRWRAPRGGSVSFDGAARRVGPRGDDHVRVSIIRGRGTALDEVWSGEAIGTTATPEPGISGYRVEENDRYYFVVRPVSTHAGQPPTLEGDEVQWNPRVQYTAVDDHCSMPPPITQGDPQPPCPEVHVNDEYAQADNFRLQPSHADGFVATARGRVGITGSIDATALPVGTQISIVRVHQPVPADLTPPDSADAGALAALELHHRLDPIETPLLTTTGGSVVPISLDDGFIVEVGDHIRFRVAFPAGSDPYALDPAIVNWHPHVRYLEICPQTPDITSCLSVPDTCVPGGYGQDRSCALTSAPGTPPTMTVPEGTVDFAPEVEVKIADLTWIPPNMQGWYQGWSVGEYDGHDDGSYALDESRFATPEPSGPEFFAGLNTAFDEMQRSAPSPDGPVPSTLPALPNVTVPTPGMTEMRPYRGPEPWRRDPSANAYAVPSWIGSGADSFIAAGSMKPSRTGGIFAEPGPSGRVRLIPLRGQEYARGGILRAGSSLDGGPTISFPLGSTGTTFGTGYGGAEFFDFNGDRRPDSIRWEPDGGVAQLQHDRTFADGTSGVEMTAGIPLHMRFGALRNVSHVTNRSGPSIDVSGLIPGVTAGGFTRTIGSTSVSYSHSEGHSLTNVDWQDINGDGLPDYVQLVREDGHSYLDVQLNLGRALGDVSRIPFEDWSNCFSEGGTCEYTPGELGRDNSETDNLQLGWQRVGGGGSYSVTRGVEQMLDMNGDGLADRVRFDTANRIRVRFNTGNGFAQQVEWSGNGFEGANALTTSSGFGVGANVGFAGQAPLGPWACLIGSIGIHADVSLQGAEIGFEDIDGDGRVDQVMRRAGVSAVSVRRNQIGHANLLRAVHNPLGGSFVLDYARQGNLVSTSTPGAGSGASERQSADGTSAKFVMPHNQWALRSVEVDDGRTDPAHSGETGHDATTLFDYFDSGNYDRAERESYGYGHVRTTRPDGAYVDAYFHNQSFQLHGLLGRVEERDAHGALLRSAVHLYEEHQVATPVDDAHAIFPAPTGTTSTLYGASAAPEDPQLTTVETRDWVERSGEWVLQAMHDHGDDRTPADDVTYTVDHFIQSSPVRCVHARDVIAAFDHPETRTAALHLPHRSAVWDSNHCVPTQLIDHVEGGLEARTGSDLSGTALATTIDYDAYGQLLHVVDPSQRGVRYQRDDQLHQYVIKVFDDIGSREYASTASWDPVFGVQTAVIDMSGEKESFAYDDFGRVTAVYAPGDGAPGATGSLPTVTFEYGPLNAATLASPARAITHHRALPTATEPVIDTVTFMDGLGRVIETQRDAVVDPGGGVGEDGVTVSGRVVYDDLGRAVQRAQPSFVASRAHAFVDPVLRNPTRTIYDALSRVIETDFPDGTSTSTSYSVANAESDLPSALTYWLDVEDTDQLGRHRHTFRDATGRIARVREFNAIGGVTRIPRYATLDTDYAYDPIGRLEHVFDALDHVTSVEYDSLGRRTSMTSPDTGATEYRYDRNGNLAERITANLRGHGSILASFTAGRLDRVDYNVDSTLLAQPSTIYHYGDPAAPHHGAGRLTSREDASGTEEFEYGVLGETTLTRRQLRDPDSATGAMLINDAGAPLTMVTSMTWDRLGRMRTLHYPGAEEITYRYDSGGALRAVETDRDPLVPYVRNIAYNEFGQRTFIEYGNGVVSRYRYTDEMRRLWTLQTITPVSGFNPTGRSVTLQNLGYEYYRNGNIFSVTDSPEADGFGQLAGMTQRFDYDDLDQLRNATGSYNTDFHRFIAPTPTHGGIWLPNTRQAFTANYEYDELGRMTRNQVDSTMQRGYGARTTTLVSRDLRYTYDGAGTAGQPVHAPTSINDAVSAASAFSRAFRWDANGNQTGYSPLVPALSGGSTRGTVWDHENRALRINDTSGDGRTSTSTRFVYDANGHRTHKASTASAGLMLYPNEWVSVRRTRRTGSDLRPRFTLLMTNHVFAGETRIASDVTNGSSTARTPYWFHSDHLSSTNYVTTNDGEIAEHVEYFPFGEPWIEENGRRASALEGTPEQFLFTSKELDQETGLYYFGARYYDPQTALWVSADPAQLSRPIDELFRPDTFELYSYCRNLPISLRDPDGLDWTTPISSRPGYSAYFNRINSGDSRRLENAGSTVAFGINGPDADSTGNLVQFDRLMASATIVDASGHSRSVPLTGYATTTTGTVQIGTWNVDSRNPNGTYGRVGVNVTRTPAANGQPGKYEMTDGPGGGAAAVEALLGQNRNLLRPGERFVGVAATQQFATYLTIGASPVIKAEWSAVSHYSVAPGLGPVGHVTSNTEAGELPSDPTHSAVTGYDEAHRTVLDAYLNRPSTSAPTPPPRATAPSRE